MIINKNKAITTVSYTLLLLVPTTFTLLSVIDANKLIMKSG